MNASMDPNTNDSTEYSVSSEATANLGDEERGLANPGRSTQVVPLSIRSRTSTASNGEETELQTRHQTESVVGSIKRKTSQLLEAVTPTSSATKADHAHVNPKLAELFGAYARSDIAASIREEGDALRRDSVDRPAGVEPGHQLPDVAAETTLLRGRKRASWGTQFRILSGRAFKNLYRDPALLTAHYLSSIALAGEFPLGELIWNTADERTKVICGLFFRNVT